MSLSLTQALFLINILTAFSFVLVFILLIVQAPHGGLKYALLFFLICVFGYLIIEHVTWGRVKTFLLFGPFLVPFSFWIVSKALFSDDRLNLKPIFLIGACVLVFFYGTYFMKPLGMDHLKPYTALLTRSISLVFILLSIYEAQIKYKSDLVEKRRKVRTLFTYFVGALVILTLLGELGLNQDNEIVPKLLQRTVILLFTCYFLLANVKLKSDLFGTSAKTPAITHPEIINSILEEVQEKELYRKETLTIGQLAETINKQEYKVRHAINQQLGYRNFTDFINSFRIEEAKSLLSNPSKRDVTILEIAYQTGFNSIGPFNRAFKSIVGQTPTEFRKQSLVR